VNMNGNELFVAIRGPLSDLVMVTESKITITIPLSFELQDVNFTELPTAYDVEAWFVQTSFSEHIKQLIPQFFAYVDYYYQAKAFFNMPLAEQLPPFKGHAFVSDFKSFRTFDGHHYDFESNCESSHVLVTDGSNGNFTILINYGSTPSFDIRIGSENVIIAADNTVVYNQNNAILPVMSASGLKINRLGDLVKLSFHDDIAVTFDTKTKLFAVEINPFYFASTGGLLGVFDNEPNYDYVTPLGSQENNVVAFVQSWEVSEIMCTRKNLISYTETSSTCEALFADNNSPFRACFPVLSTEPFMAMCAFDQADYCKVAMSYKHTCQLNGVPVAMPNECMQCIDSTGTAFSVGETQTMQTGSVDVVLVLQETSCLRSRSKHLSKFLRKFLKQTSGTFKSMQLPNTQFYVVGYGGPGTNSVPHSFTMRGELSSNKKSDISKVIRKIDLSPAGTSSDAVAAIDFASKLAFRPGTQQIILHISCDECSRSSMTAGVQRNLVERNIVLHHMPIQSIDSSGDSKIYGYSESEAFAKKSKSVDRSQINESGNDQCLPLAFSSGGSVWNGIEMKSSELVNVFTSYMGSNATPGGRRTCTCELNESGSVAARCTNN